MVNNQSQIIPTVTNYPKCLIPTEDGTARRDAVQMSLDEMMQFVDTLIDKEVDDG